MIDFNTRVFVDRMAHMDSYGFYFVQPNGRESALLVPEWREVHMEPSTPVPDHSFRLSSSQAQEVMNQLWGQGIRPNNGEGTKAHAESQERHIADLREIAFHALKIPAARR